MLASAKTTRDPALSPVRAGWFAFPLAPALRSTDSAAVTESGCALFAGFPATMTGLDFPRPYIIGYSSSLSRHGLPASSAGGQTWDLPASDAIRLHVFCPAPEIPRACVLKHPQIRPLNRKGFSAESQTRVTVVFRK